MDGEARARMLPVPGSGAYPARPLDYGWQAAMWTGAAYFAGAKLGLALTFAPSPVAILWPPNAILTAVLLLAPVRAWPLALGAVLPAHLLAELGAGIPLPMVLSWYVSNCTEALLAATGIRLATRAPFSFRSLRNVVAFLAFGVLLAPLLSSFLDAAFVELNGWGERGYLEVWENRLFSNALSALIIVPPIVTLWNDSRGARRGLPPRRVLEATLLAVALCLLAVLAFDLEVARTSPSLPALLFLPIPVLVWIALRFGSGGSSVAFALFALVAIWGAGNGRGPFQWGTEPVRARAVQLSLIALATPLLALAAVLEERREAERRLRNSEERFAVAFRSSPDAMSISVAGDGRVIDVNDRWLSLFGYSRPEALGQPLVDLLGPVSQKHRHRMLHSAASSGRDLEIEARDRHGQRLRLVLSMETVELDDETCTLTTIRDLTLQRRAEVEAHEQRQQLTHLARVSMLGELAGALAHDLQQPLTAILTNTAVVQRLLAKSPADLGQAQEILEEIAAADHRAATVIQHLRALLRKGTGELAPLDLNDVLDEVLEFVHGEVITHHVTLSTRLAPRLPPIAGDRIQLQQLFLNLVTNACEAMSTVGAEQRILTVGSALAAGDVVQASIADSGPGIQGARIDKVFEPFFTTKSKGLGLGLAICRTIVTAHGGRIWAKNGLERGVTFYAEFPSIREPAR